MEDIKFGVYSKGKSKILVFMLNQNRGEVFYRRRWGGTWANSRNVMSKEELDKWKFEYEV